MSVLTEPREAFSVPGIAEACTPLALAALKSSTKARSWSPCLCASAARSITWPQRDSAPRHSSLVARSRCSH